MQKEVSKNTEEEIINLINHHDNILILASAPPDGDCLGSALALYLALKKLNKNATVLCCDPIPDILKFLPDIGTVQKNLSANTDFIISLDTEDTNVENIKYEIDHNKINLIITPEDGTFTAEDISFNYGNHKYDLIITVDTADVGQLGKNYTQNTHLFSEVPIINIDHHASNTYFGRINFVNVMASSTTEMLTPIIDLMESKFKLGIWDDDIATLLLAGIITDTGSFQNANTTSMSFKMSAALIRKGGRQQEIIKNVFKTKQLATLHLWGKILSHVKVDNKARLAWSIVSQKDFLSSHTKSEDSGEIIDELMTNAKGAELIVLLKETDDGKIKGSIRSKVEAADASKIAAIFEGGGHTKAAGFKLKRGDRDFELEAAEIIQKIKDMQLSRLQVFNQSEETIKFEKESINQKEAPIRISEPSVNNGNKIFGNLMSNNTISLKDLNKNNSENKTNSDSQTDCTQSGIANSVIEIEKIIEDEVKKQDED